MIPTLKKIYFRGKREYQKTLFLLFSDESRLKKPFKQLQQTFFQRYWENVAKSIGAEIDSVGYGFYRLKRNGLATFVREGKVMLDDYLTLNIAGNKPLVHKLLVEKGFTVPEYLEYEISSLDEALNFMEQKKGNFVVKPASGTGAGAGITTKINSPARLRKASSVASAFSKKLIIEREIPGLSYRLLYLNGEFIDAICRDSPAVVGDGKSTIKQLIQNETKKRLTASPAYSLSPLSADLDCEYTLADSGYTLNHVPKKGERCIIKTAANQYSQFENHSVKNTIHPSIIEHGRKLSKVINVTFSGVDLMMTDCSVPLEESGCVVNEINTTPGLHHHALVSQPEEVIPVGEIVIEYIFKNMQTISETLPSKETI